MESFTYFDILISLALAVIISGVIGFERETKSKPAGLKTHIIVCVSATIVALIQREMTFTTLSYISQHPELKGIVSLRTTDMLANVITGIGFLGAGTIIVTKGKVAGLTTAASVWGVAVLGLGIGLGYWQVSITGAVVIFAALEFIDKVLIGVYDIKVRIQYENGEVGLDNINNFMNLMQIKILTVDGKSEKKDENEKSVIVYTMQISKKTESREVIEGLSNLRDVKTVTII